MILLYSSAWVIGKENLLHHLLIQFPGSREIWLHISHGNLMSTNVIHRKTYLFIIGTNIILSYGSPSMAKSIRCYLQFTILQCIHTEFL